RPFTTEDLVAFHQQCAATLEAEGALAAEKLDLAGALQVALCCESTLSLCPEGIGAVEHLCIVEHIDARPLLPVWPGSLVDATAFHDEGGIAHLAEGAVRPVDDGVLGEEGEGQ